MNDKKVKLDKKNIAESIKQENSIKTQPIQEQKNSNAIAGMVLGIVSVVLFWIPYVSITCGIVGIILSVKGRKLAEKKSMATAGLILSIISLALWAIIILIMIMIFLCTFFFLAL